MAVSVKGFILDTKLGEGATASVWSAHHVHAPVKTAIKQISKEQKNVITSPTQVIHEVNLHSQIDHPFIAKLFDVVEDDNNYYLIQEFVEHGTLLSLLNQRGKLPENIARRYFMQLISAVDYLHFDQHIVHQDIKCENILLDRHNNLKLINLGFSRIFQTLDEQFNTLCGSPAYVAPEIINERKYGRCIDIWSCGIVLFAMTTGFLPFFDNDPTKNLANICTNQLRCPMFLSDSLVDLLNKLLCKDPRLRIDLTGIYRHPWFADQQFRTIVEIPHKMNTLSFSGRSWSQIDFDTIVRMEADGLECKEMTQTLLSGEKAEMTMLYDIYLQEIQTDKINEWMKMTEQSGNQVVQVQQKRNGSAGTRESAFSPQIATNDQTTQNQRRQRRLSFAMGLQKYRMGGVDHKLARPIIIQAQRRLIKPFVPQY
jgi:serine/threonine protein kinase